MAELENVFSKGTEPIHIPGDIERSEIFVPSSEDWSFVVKPYDTIKAAKFWSDNEASLKTVKYDERCPIGIGEYTLAHCFPESIFKVFGHLNVCMVRDKGNQGAWQGGVMLLPGDSPTNFVEYGEIQELVALDPSGQYHNGKPPWQTGRIYWGFNHNRRYYVFLPGYGIKTNTIQKTFEDDDYIYTLEIDHDASGKVLDFRVTAEEKQTITCVKDESYTFWGYESDDASSDLYYNFVNMWETYDVFKETEGPYAGQYYYKLRAELDAGAGLMGHTPTAGEWIVRGWTDYDATTKEFSGLYFEHDKCAFGLNNDLSNYIKVYLPRKGTANKNQYFKGGNIYQIADSVSDNPCYIQVCEKKLPDYRGSIISASVPAGEEKALAFPGWGLFWQIFGQWYNPNADEVYNGAWPSDESQYPCSCVIIKNDFLSANEEYTDVCIFNDLKTSTAGKPATWQDLPQKTDPGIGAPRNYHFEYYSLSATIKFDSKYDLGGGMVVVSRAASNWKRWDSGINDWIQAEPGTEIYFYASDVADLVIAERSDLGVRAS
ncbi:MAG TPA: hypothetical protein ENF45_03825, partial [Bacteroidetes bacterium]|nr:hypothetical protein [Bacteroidota bacterium]